MAELSNKSLHEVCRNGTLKEVTEVVDTELKSLGKILLQHRLELRNPPKMHLFIARLLLYVVFRVCKDYWIPLI